MKRKIVFIVLSFIMTLSYGRGYHVTVDGKATADGSINNPWSLAAAFDRNNPIKPSGGDTIFIHKGTYVGTPHVWFGGQVNNHVVITNWQNDVVVIDGNTGVDDAAVIYIQAEGGGYVTIDGLTVTNSHPQRTTTTSGSFPPYPQNMAGIQSATANYQIKNCIIHDNHGNGVGGFGGNALITGNIFYYNGWDAPDRGHCYGLYVQNDDPNKVIDIHHNIIYANFNKGTHVYVTNGTVIENIKINNNISFEAAKPSHDGPVENDIFVGGLVPLRNIEVKDNHTYLSSNDRGNCIRLGYYDQDNTKLTFTGNYMVGGSSTITVRYWEDIEVKNNFLFSKNYWITELMHNNEDLSQWDWGNNRYYYTGIRSDFMNGKTWNNWEFKNDQCTITLGRPSRNEYFLDYYPNNNWASLVVYDWTGVGYVDVDLSTVFEANSSYSIYDVQNIDGQPIVEGVFKVGDKVRIPTNLKDVTPVFGSDVPNQPTHTDEEFNVFIVRSDQFISVAKCDVSITNVSPNPTDDKVKVDFTISGECSDPVNAYLVSPFGSILDLKENVTTGFEFDITSVCPMECLSGLYSVKLKCGSIEKSESFQYFKKRTFRILFYYPNPIPEMENLENIAFMAQQSSSINWELKDEIGDVIKNGEFNTDTMKSTIIDSYRFVLNFGSITEGIYLLYMNDGFSKDSCRIQRK